MNTLTEIRIDPKYKGFIPPLAEDEYSKLEANLLEEGCRDALIVYLEQGILLDGHNRYEICKRYGISYEVKEISFASEQDALIWLIQNQLGRRNLSTFAKVELTLELEPLFAEKAKETKGNRNDLYQNSDKGEPIHTKKELAKAGGVSHDTIHRAKVIKEKASEEDKVALRQGQKSINEVYKGIQGERQDKDTSKAAEVYEKFLMDFDPDLRAAIIKTAKAQAQSLNKPLSEGMIKRVGEVLTEAATTGHVDIGDGFSNPVIAAVNASEYEALMRQREHIRNNLTSDSEEWYTPSEYIDAAKLVMGGIDIDPATNETAQGIIQAKTFYTKQQDGLQHDWFGRLWLNPPYGKQCVAFVSRAINQFEIGNLDEGILLLNSNSSDSSWWQPLWDYTLCFFNGRINFYSLDGELKNNSTHGTCFVYLGTKHRQEFKDTFGKLGAIVRRFE